MKQLTVVLPALLALGLAAWSCGGAPARERIDARRKVVMPGLVDGHRPG